MESLTSLLKSPSFWLCFAFLSLLAIACISIEAEATHEATAVVSGKLKSVELGMENIYSKFDKIAVAVETCDAMQKELPAIQAEFKQVHKHLMDIQAALKNAKD